MAAPALAPTTRAAPPAPRPDAGATYWERLREPEHLVERDLALIARIPRTTPVLDVGCGNGGFVRACLDRRGILRGYRQWIRPRQKADA